MGVSSFEIIEDFSESNRIAFPDTILGVLFGRSESNRIYFDDLLPECMLGLTL